MLERGHYVTSVKYLNSPLVSPLCDTNFRDLSPILIISGEVETLRDESYLYQELINSSYSDEELDSFQIPPSTLHLYEEMFHVFPMILPALPSSRVSFKRAANFIKQCFAKNSSNFSQVKDKFPINEGIRETETNSLRPRKWRNLYLSTIEDHKLAPFSPAYKRVQIQPWGGSNIIEKSKL
ncbi:hypothetical protein CONCODRAFT_168312 [Conidiobolus coronatus NRRL 28638]|uniref:Uncharacterized protein n=1 Tax=Conidiobolus coronatus (strain ATCC 28846 / CBS 209.66 / NRRL 28638) TaxID=796925 RepID=A0A137NV72_CONC2|nr:hypothetical protein CONCODRAFT_168312 [Conidiobolus coronatus NRRL 28638]|eukprot:KXN66514.1 hypothetical protein CONCODRAFT_168312 [Conidiobolus coronatus NRRL 28638]